MASKAENRARKTAKVGKLEDGRILVQNGHKGRSQKGCFGGGNKK